MTNAEHFEPGCIYHVYSHANGKDVLFAEDSNYQYFLERLLKYITPIAEIYAYYLMPNHFHLLVKFKDLENDEVVNEHQYLMKPFSNFLNSYAKAYNKKYNRKGALFLDFLRRKKVQDEKYLLKVLHYIHNNPVHHGFTSQVEKWKYSSYINIEKPSSLERSTILKYFDAKEDFIGYHRSNVEYDFMNLE
ncbi:REP element-mobilizing transposase RayT [Chryseobacterium sp. 52]|uniref:transposase n=1 Tax=Chryseobacterium sp. 52 TaxID=2035213 RepID=UPI000C185BE6|nr:transposase [Chryseobacterium sp. 52]PIF43169.1 REP element-mobilizing transposase RayT [Chryseobacterium sp. 52]